MSSTLHTAASGAADRCTLGRPQPVKQPEKGSQPEHQPFQTWSIIVETGQRAFVLERTIISPNKHMKPSIIRLVCSITCIVPGIFLFTVSLQSQDYSIEERFLRIYLPLISLSLSLLLMGVNILISSKHQRVKDILFWTSFASLLVTSLSSLIA